MIDEFIKTLPLALCAAINPVGILILIAVLVAGTDRIKRSLGFVIGFLVALYAIGIIVLVIFDNVLSDLHIDTDAIKCDFDWAILVAVIAYFGYKIITKKADKHEETIAKNKDQSRKSNGWIMYGVLYAITDLTSLIPYAILLKDVSGSKLSFADKATSLLLTNLVIFLPLLLLPLICIIFPNKSDAILRELKSVLSDHKKTISAIILIIIVVYLAFKISQCLV